MADGHVTIADVAAAAGVSVATVSKVINDRYGVAEQTSAHVRAVIEQLGYTSSLVAQSLRSRRSNVIGVITADIEPFNAELLKGAAQAIRGTGYDLVVFSDCGRREDQAGWEQRSLARVSALTDGSILVTPSSVDVTLRRAARRRRPQRALLDAPDGGLRQPQGRGRGDRAPDRARPPAYRLPRGTPRPRVRAAPRAGLPRRAGGGRHPVRPRPWSASAATGPTPRPRPPATSCGAKDGRRRSSLRTTRRRSRR